MSCDGSAMQQHDQVAMCVCAEARVKSIKMAASKGLMAKVGREGGKGGVAQGQWTWTVCPTSPAGGGGPAGLPFQGIPAALACRTCQIDPFFKSWYGEMMQRNNVQAHGPKKMQMMMSCIMLDDFPNGSTYVCS